MSYTGTKWQYGNGTWSDLMMGLEEIQGVNGGSETGAAGAVALQSISENEEQPKTKGIFSRAMAQRNSQSENRPLIVWSFYFLDEFYN